MTTAGKSPESYDFLVDAARKMGAKNAKIISTSDVFVENRVALKCRAGCIAYGQKLTCPPFVPTPDEFRRILSEYQYALLVKFTSDAEADPDVICSIYKYWLDPQAPADKKEKAEKFWKDYFQGSRESLLLCSNSRRLHLTPDVPLPSRL